MQFGTCDNTNNNDHLRERVDDFLAISESRIIITKSEKKGRREKKNSEKRKNELVGITRNFVFQRDNM